MANWLFVLNNSDALDWVTTSKRMAFRKIKQPVPSIERGDGFVIYASTRALVSAMGSHKKALEFGPRIVAFGTISSTLDYEDKPLQIGGRTFHASCRLQFEAQLDLVHSVSFKKLVPRLNFIFNKDKWQYYVWRTLIPLSNRDYGLLTRAVRACS